jgi:hypothetical protein
MIHVVGIRLQVRIVSGGRWTDELRRRFTTAKQLVGHALLVDAFADRLTDPDIAHRRVHGVQAQEDGFHAGGGHTLRRRGGVLGGEETGKLGFAGHHHRGAHGRLVPEDELRFVDGHLAQGILGPDAPPVRIGFEPDVLAPVPFPEDVWPGADRVVWQRVRLVLDLLHAGNRREVEPRRQDRVGCFGDHVDRVLVDRGRGHVRAHVLVDLEVVLGRPRVVDPERRYLRVEGFAVVKRHAFAQCEPPGHVIRLLPTCRQLAHKLVGDGIAVQQGFLDVANDGMAIGAVCPPVFERVWLNGQREDDLAARLGRLGAEEPARCRESNARGGKGDTEGGGALDDAASRVAVTGRIAYEQSTTPGFRPNHDGFLL